jgi:hypothetical protein
MYIFFGEGLGWIVGLIGASRKQFSWLNGDPKSHHFIYRFAQFLGWLYGLDGLPHFL